MSAQLIFSCGTPVVPAFSAYSVNQLGMPSEPSVSGNTNVCLAWKLAHIFGKFARAVVYIVRVVPFCKWTDPERTCENDQEFLAKKTVCKVMYWQKVKYIIINVPLQNNPMRFLYKLKIDF